jgi:hypothetical protein
MELGKNPNIANNFFSIKCIIPKLSTKMYDNKLSFSVKRYHQQDFTRKTNVIRNVALKIGNLQFKNINIIHFMSVLMVIKD